jgi:hypothetical protein
MCGRGLCLPSSTSPNRREARRLVDEWVEMLPDPTWRDQVRAVARHTPLDLFGERPAPLWASALHDLGQ